MLTAEQPSRTASTHQWVSTAFQIFQLSSGEGKNIYRGRISFLVKLAKLVLPRQKVVVGSMAAQSLDSPVT